MNVDTTSHNEPSLSMPPLLGRKVLVIEDDEAMAAALRHGFECEGYDVTVAENGAVGLEHAAAERRDLVILDLMMPRVDGFDVCKRLRSAGNRVPIIMLTARGEEIDKIVGLRLGADDYVTKPFSFMELVARAEAVLRRTTGESKPACHVCCFGDVVVDFKRHEATKGGRPVELSAREFQLVEYFYQHRGEVVTRSDLLDAVWGYQSVPFTRTVDTHIAKLRKKIEDRPADPRFIVTVHRVGYKFAG